MDSLGKLFIVAGIVLLLIGVAFTLGFKGLPGDVYVKKDNFSFYMPLASSILLSILLSLILYFSLRR